MAIKDILLHLDSTQSCQERIEFGIRLAKRHNARLKGLYIISHPYYAPRLSAAESDSSRMVEALFKLKTSGAGISSEWQLIDWSVVGIRISEIATLHSYYTDLVILGQPGEEANKAGIPFDMVERVGLAGGKPMIVLPYTGQYCTDGVKRAMIAWKAGRESSRALNDALPLLIDAELVTLITVGTPDSSEASVSEDIGRVIDYLARHGIKSVHEKILPPPSLPIGDALLNHACEQKMDILIAGGYAVSRRGTFMMSPIARHLMNHMTLPVFMSH